MFISISKRCFLMTSCTSYLEDTSEEFVNNGKEDRQAIILPIVPYHKLPKLGNYIEVRSRNFIY